MCRLLFLLVSLMLLVGCAENTRPIVEAKPVDDGRKETVTVSAGKAPEKSEPDAAQMVTEAIAAHTKNQPALLEKLKSVSFTRDGMMAFQGPNPVKNTVKAHAVWPDNLRFRMEFPGQVVITISRTAQGGWTHSSTAVPPTKVPMTAENFSDVRVDSSGEWLLLLFPLLDPKTIVATAPEKTILGKPAVGVRIWSPGIADSVMYFDKTTKLLVQLNFEGREDRQKVMKEILVLGSKSYSGVILPEKIAYKAAGNQLAEWTITNVEPGPIDSKVFDNP